ncbi:MAG TPA: hypothetical protein VHE35_26040 [Kofleriaceae bacterium]|nr:hypothetical protein [Kofleriaceae bacterium]
MLKSFAVVLAFGVAACGGSGKTAKEPAPATGSGGGSAAGSEGGSGAGSGSGSAASQVSDQELEQVLTQSLDFYDAFATAVSDNAKDCKSMALDLDQVFDDHKALLEKVRSMQGDPTLKARGSNFMSSHEDRIKAANDKMAAGIDACSSDPDVRERLQRFDDL